MKYFIVSDVHGSLHYVSKAFERFKESNADYFICLGDFYYHGPRNPLTQDYNPMKVSELFNSLGNKLIAIRGNCDAEVDQMISTFIFKDNYTFNLSDNLKVYCHHGHKDIENIHQFNLILSGHTHVGVLKNDDGVLLGVSEVGRENYKEFHEKHNKLFGESYCRTTISSKRIGQDIKIIADFAFMGELDYTDSLTIEDVLIIGEGAFAVNPNLRFLEIGSSVLCISESCFEKNDMLENVTIPNTVRYIFNTIFYDCKSILSINVSEDTSIIGWQGGKVQEVERNMIMWDSYTDTNRYIIAV